MGPISRIRNRNRRRLAAAAALRQDVGAAETSVDGVVVVDEVEPLGSVLAGAEVVLVVVNPCGAVVVVLPVFLDVFPPLAAGAVVVVVVVDEVVDPGNGVPSTSWACLIAVDMALRSVWNCARSAALSAIRALL
jgi:hypothetical protein